MALSGPSGTGKSHFVEALAHAVIDAGMRVSWFTLEPLTATMGRAKVTPRSAASWPASVEAS